MLWLLGHCSSVCIDCVLLGKGSLHVSSKSAWVGVFQSLTRHAENLPVKVGISVFVLSLGFVFLTGSQLLDSIQVYFSFLLFLQNSLHAILVSQQAFVMGSPCDRKPWPIPFCFIRLNVRK